jgi:sec-independent protein translocase protein TatC
MTLAEHLKEIRYRFFVCAATILVIGIAAWFFYPQILHFLQEPYCKAAPWQIWRFITPGMKAKERKYAVPFVAASIVFFAAGVLVAYFIFGQAIQWLQSIGGKTLISHYNPNQYLSLFLLTMFIFGLTFLFPVILVALELAGLVTPKQLLKSWRYAVIIITVAAAVFTPSGDPISMLILAAPLVAFYFLAIGVGKLFKK